MKISPYHLLPPPLFLNILCTIPERLLSLSSTSCHHHYFSIFSALYQRDYSPYPPSLPPPLLLLALYQRDYSPYPPPPATTIISIREITLLILHPCHHHYSYQRDYSPYPPPLPPPLLLSERLLSLSSTHATTMSVLIILFVKLLFFIPQVFLHLLVILLSLHPLVILPSLHPQVILPSLHPQAIPLSHLPLAIQLLLQGAIPSNHPLRVTKETHHNFHV